MKRKLLLRFYNKKMLLTLDIETLLFLILEECGYSVILDIEEMTEDERGLAEDRTGAIPHVATRFILEDHTHPDRPRRLEDLEYRIVQYGQK
jgi:hypothetical protein